MDNGRRSLQPEAFVHQPLQSRTVEDVVGQFLVWKHSQCRAPGAGHQFRGFFHGQVGVLADHRHDHAHHELQPPDVSGFLLLLGQVRGPFSPLLCTHCSPRTGSEPLTNNCLPVLFDAPPQPRDALISTGLFCELLEANTTSPGCRTSVTPAHRGTITQLQERRKTDAG